MEKYYEIYEEHVISSAEDEHKQTIERFITLAPTEDIAKDFVKHRCCCVYRECIIKK